ncbi:hypothetical protein JB92DRAFT_3032638, partial [Gautieria morchelliformis]
QGNSLLLLSPLPPPQKRLQCLLRRYLRPSRILSASPRAPYQESRTPRMQRRPLWGSSQRAHLAVQNPNHPRHGRMKLHIVL